METEAERVREKEREREREGASRQTNRQGQGQTDRHTQQDGEGREMKGRKSERKKGMRRERASEGWGIHADRQTGQRKRQIRRTD